MEDTTEEYVIDVGEGDGDLDERKNETNEQFGNANGRWQSPISEVERYLLFYRAGSRLLEMNQYERSYFGYTARNEPYEESEAYIKARLYEIRAFILSIGECDEKLFLYYYYVHGESMERCAELLSVSRATVYRLKRSALRLAALYYEAGRPTAL